MAKRFTDTNKYKKPFIRGLKGPYKLLWDYLYHDCDHAGIWIPDFEIAQVYLGDDMPVTKEGALECFGNKIIVVSEDKWFIPSFIEHQYGKLSEDNRAHRSVLIILDKLGLINNKGLIRGLEGCKDKDKDKDSIQSKIKGKEKEIEYSEAFISFWKIYPRKVSKADAFGAWAKIPDKENVLEKIKSALLWQVVSLDWTKEGGQYIPYPATYLNDQRWLDEPALAPKPPRYFGG